MTEAPGLNRRHLLGLEQLSRQEIDLILDTADSFREVIDRPIRKVPALRGRNIVNLFFESSTRTRISFELAEKQLSADSVNFTSSGSSVSKGETLLDTARNVESMKVDCVVVRHPASGASHFLADHLTQTTVINAGDGAHEHPTQGLLDIHTIRDRLGNVDGKRVVIVGDITHSRVARSDIWGLRTMGASVAVCGPPTMLPVDIESMGVDVFHNLEEAIKDADVINMLRIQLERQKGGLFPSLREYSRLFGLNAEKLKHAKPDAIVMHPGPINRGVELDASVADGDRSVILDQVTNGVAVRMAVLFLLLGGSDRDGD
ncbi:MAG: aspartate carbamoyltransferase catalytic subunit [Candidatus Latescibacteria bacterium]|jgi:aspartate carbamoyltransferase catalytic subunit|nr:aspartate carbamoyltransferase catalytic subunit [Candidatus Latescibacterota bacterium]